MGKPSDEWHPRWWNPDKPYANTWWRKQRELFFSKAENVLCAICLIFGRDTIATELDHKRPFGRSWALFSDPNNWQGLCVLCHSGIKRVQENRGYSKACDLDGVPIDAGHPWSKEL